MRASADLLTKTKAHNSGQPTFGSVCSVGQSSRVNFSNQARPVEVPKSQLKTLETPANVPSPEPHWSYFVVVAFIKKRQSRAVRFPNLCPTRILEFCIFPLSPFPYCNWHAMLEFSKFFFRIFHALYGKRGAAKLTDVIL